METVVVVLMILVCFNFMMKQTFRKRGSVAAIAVVATVLEKISALKVRLYSLASENSQKPAKNK